MQFEKIKTCNFGEIGKGQANVNLRYVANKEISKVLAIKCDAIVTDSKVQENLVNYKGRAECKLVFVDTNGELQSATFFTEFNDSIVATAGEGERSFKCVTVDVNHTVSANVVVVNCLVEVKLWAFETHVGQNLLSGVNLLTSPKTFVERGAIHDCTLEVDSQWNLDFELNILSCFCEVVVDDCTAQEEVLTVVGRGFLHLTALSEGKILSKVLPFDVNGQCMCATEGQLTVQATVKNTKLHVEVDGSSTLLSMDVTLGLEVKELVVATKEIAMDAYSTTSLLNVEYQQIPCTKLCGRANFTTNCALEDNAQDYVGTALYGVVLTNAVVQHKTVTAEGVVSVVLVYKDQDYWSKEVEIPFSCQTPVDFSCDGSVCACATLGEVTAVANGDNLEINAVVNVVAECFEEELVKTLCQAQEVGSLPKRSTIEICMAKKGETLWQLGKSMGVDVDEILLINPDLSNPLEKDTKIVLYHKID